MSLIRRIKDRLKLFIFKNTHDEEDYWNVYWKTKEELNKSKTINVRLVNKGRVKPIKDDNPYE